MNQTFYFRDNDLRGVVGRQKMESPTKKTFLQSFCIGAVSGTLSSVILQPLGNQDLKVQESIQSSSYMPIGKEGYYQSNWSFLMSH